MTNSNFQKLLNSLSKDPLCDFLIGRDKANVILCRYADMPTDPELVVDALKQWRDIDSSAVEKIERAFLELIETPEGTWMGMYYVNILLNEQINNRNKLLDVYKIANALKLSLSNFRKELELNKKWSGIIYSDGLWGDVNRLAKIIFEKYSVLLVAGI